MDFFISIVVGFGFFTTVPVPFIEWEGKYFRYIPIVLPMIGLFVGGLGYLLMMLFGMLDTSPILYSIFIIIYFVVITGGLHLDAVMDTADAFFSRRDIDRKLEIMKDSRVGAFAVVSAIIFFLLKFGLIHEMLIREKSLLYFIIIPMLSRSFQALMLYNCKYATDEGIAKLYKGVIKKWDQLYIILFNTVVLGFALSLNLKVLPLVIASLLFAIYYKRFSVKQFRGITGDIIGAFLELTEVILIAIVVFVL